MMIIIMPIILLGIIILLVGAWRAHVRAVQEGNVGVVHVTEDAELVDGRQTGDRLIAVVAIIAVIAIQADSTHDI